jgi:hypothetical protein
MDLFDFYRYALGTVVTIYATLITVQWAMGWYAWLKQPHRATTMLRRYLLISGLRLRVTDFGTDILVNILLCVLFVMLWHARGTMSDIQKTLSDGQRKPQPLHWRVD